MLTAPKTSVISTATTTKYGFFSAARIIGITPRSFVRQETRPEPLLPPRSNGSLPILYPPADRLSRLPYNAYRSSRLTEPEVSTITVGRSATRSLPGRPERLKPAVADQAPQIMQESGLKCHEITKKCHRCLYQLLPIGLKGARRTSRDHDDVVKDQLGNWREESP